MLSSAPGLVPGADVLILGQRSAAAIVDKLGAKLDDFAVVGLSSSRPSNRFVIIVHLSVAKQWLTGS